MLSTTNINQINKALENSFAAVKKDMDEIKAALSMQSDQSSLLKKEIENAKTDFVSKDKVNVLKIKIGELNEGLKKIWDIERQIKSAGSLGQSKNLQSSVDELNSKLIAMNMKVNELNKTYVSESQLKLLMNEINSELNSMASALREAEVRRDDVRRKDIEKYNEHLVKRIDSVNNDFEKLKQKLKVCVDKEELKKILETLNSDFSGVRNEIKKVYEENKAFITEKEMKDTLESVNKEFDSIAGEIESLRKQDKEFITAANMKGLIDDISDEFKEIKSDVSGIKSKKDISATKKEFEELREEFSGLQKEVDRLERNTVTKDDFAEELKQIEKELDGMNKKPATYGASVVLKEKKPAKKIKVNQKIKFIAGNVLIVLAFILLIASIVSYFIGSQVWMDNFAIGAVAAFIVGMFIRAYAAIKSGKV